MTKAQLEALIDELETKLAKAEVELKNAIDLKVLATNGLKNEQAKNKRLRGVLKDLLINEDLKVNDH